MEVFAVMHRTFLALAVFAAISVSGITLAQHSGNGQVKVTQLSRRDIIEKPDRDDKEVTFPVSGSK